MKYKLCIAIPTFNRAVRLEKAFKDLLSQIIHAKKKQLLSVFVSNNGSTDGTSDVIERYKENFKKNDICFSSFSFNYNRGFDANVLNCYKRCDAEYVWFLSDDDNIMDGAICSIMDDIQTFSPTVLFYNFNQPPFLIGNQYIQETNLFNYVDEENIQSISKIIYWPKLSALVIKVSDEWLYSDLDDFNYGFMHVALAIQAALNSGRVLHSVNFVAGPDDDYLDHIDFPPYIGNSLVEMIDVIFLKNERYDIYNKLDLKKNDSLSVSLAYLGSYYRGRIKISPSLKSEIHANILYEIRNIQIKNMDIGVLALSIIKYIISYVYCIIHVFLLGKGPIKS